MNKKCMWMWAITACLFYVQIIVLNTRAVVTTKPLKPDLYITVGKVTNDTLYIYRTWGRK